MYLPSHRGLIVFCHTVFLVSLSSWAGCSSQSNPENAGSSEPAEQSVASESVSQQSTEPSEADNQVTDSESVSSVVLEPLPEPEGEDGRFSIAQIMNLGHDNKLYRELLTHPVNPDVAERMLTLYRDLPSQVPPQGDLDDWKERANNLLRAAESAVAGDSGSDAALKRAVNCSSCHNRFRD